MSTLLNYHVLPECLPVTFLLVFTYKIIGLIKGDEVLYKKVILSLAILVFFSSFITAALPISNAANNISQFRVYQNSTPLKEFSMLEQAKKYATQFNYAHVEKITNKEWVWDNLPKYKVYIDGKSSDSLDFATLKEATAAASKQGNSYIREIENVGWAYKNLAQYIVYQGDKKLPNGSFTSLAAAKKEAAKWANTFILDSNTNEWIWDNISTEKRASLKSGNKVYEIHQDDAIVESQASYGFLKEALIALKAFGSGKIYNNETHTYVFSTEQAYDVYSQGVLQASYSSLDEAVAAAKPLYMAEVTQDTNLYWSNKPFYAVLQGEKTVKYFFTLKSALSLANTLKNASITFNDERTIWTNKDNFIYLGWNGTSTASVIDSHIANTQGLDIDSPTWYYLENAQGAINDRSSSSLVKQYADAGIDLIPLVHNQFDPKMTSEFLANADAQTKFINALITSLKSIKAKGLNLDFEEVASKDRALFTAFVKRLSEAAHNEKLTISIDMLRGDTSWNDRTAYDREAIGQYVDYVIIMAYDQYWKGSTSAGSVAGLKWVEEGINQYLNYGIPRDKLILGIPFYTREWRIDSNNKLVDNKAILMNDIDTIIKANNATVVFDHQFGQNKVSYTKDGYTHVFWAETVDTVKARVELAKKYDLAGVAAWRLGYEQAAVWDELIKLK